MPPGIPKSGPRPPRLHGADLVFAVRSRLVKGYPQTGGVPKFEQAKRDVNALLGEIEMLRKMLKDQEAAFDLATSRLAQVGAGR